MKDVDVVNNFNNSWRALCQQYKDNPDENIRCALNMLGKIINEVNKQVTEANTDEQLTIEDWLKWFGVKTNEM